MEQRCFIQHCVGIYTVLQDSYFHRDKIKTYKLSREHEVIHMKEKVKVKSLSRVQLFATPWTVAYQAPQTMGFSRQGYWSGLPFPSPGDLPNPAIEPRDGTRVSCIGGRRFNL